MGCGLTVLELEATTRRGSFELNAALSAQAGECVALAGPSGAGKTTILRIAAGLTDPEVGRVSCAGEVWLDTATGVRVPPEHRRVGYLFQEYALFPNMSALRNVSYGLAGLSRAERETRASRMLERFGLGDRAGARPDDLSGGERQRVALARALAREPQALLLDEPLSALDPRTRMHSARELGSLFRDLDVPVVLVTHDFAEAALLASRIAVIDAGRMVQEGDAARLAAAPESAFVADFTGAVVIKGTATSAGGSATRIELDGGGTIWSTDPGNGAVAATIHPWEITIEHGATPPTGSAQNRLPARVATVTSVGGRVRIGLEAGQPLVAEVTAASVERLAIAPGLEVVATWKAAATRLVPAGQPLASPEV